MVVRIRCTHSDCGQVYKVADEQIGQTAVCQKCKRSFVLSGPSQETAAGAGQIGHCEASPAADASSASPPAVAR